MPKRIEHAIPNPFIARTSLIVQTNTDLFNNVHRPDVDDKIIHVFKICALTVALASNPLSIETNSKTKVVLGTCTEHITSATRVC